MFEFPVGFSADNYLVYYARKWSLSWLWLKLRRKRVITYASEIQVTRKGQMIFIDGAPMEEKPRIIGHAIENSYPDAYGHNVVRIKLI